MSAEKNLFPDGMCPVICTKRNECFLAESIYAQEESGGLPNENLVEYCGDCIRIAPTDSYNCTQQDGVREAAIKALSKRGISISALDENLANSATSV